MIFDEKFYESADFLSFCCTLNTLDLEELREIGSLETSTSVFAFETKIKLLFAVLSSRCSYKQKNKASLYLKSILSHWNITKSSTLILLSKSKSYLLHLIQLEENNQFQEELLSLYLSVVLAVDITPNRWKSISKLIISCISHRKSHLSNVIHNLIIDNPKLFGNNKRQRLKQYRNLLSKCLSQHSTKPHVLLFAMNVFCRVVQKNKNSNSTNRILTKLMPSLFDSMEAVILTLHGSEFMDSLFAVFFNTKNLFKNYAKKMIRRILGILRNTNVDKPIVLKLYYWIEIFVREFPEYVQIKWHPFIATVVDNLLTFQESCYPNLATGAHNDYHKCEEIRQSQDATDASQYLTRIVLLLNPEHMFNLLESRFSALLTKRGWKSKAVAMRLLQTIIMISENVAADFDPSTLLPIFDRYYLSINPVVGCFTIKTCEALFCQYAGRPLGNLRGEAKLDLASLGEYSYSLNIKIQAFKSFGTISGEFLLENDRTNSSERAVLCLFGLFSAFSTNKDPQLKSLLLEVITCNIGCLFDFLGCVIDAYVPEIMVNLLNMLDMTMVDRDYDILTYRVLVCIQKTISFNFPVQHQKFIPIIARYVDGTSHPHQLFPDFGEVPPCIFIHLLEFSTRKTKYSKSIIPKIFSSIHKYLNNVISSKSCEKSVETMNGKAEPCLTIRYRIGCSECFAYESDGGIHRICVVISELVKTYGSTLVDDVSDCLVSIDDILKNLHVLSFDYSGIVEGIHLLMRSTIHFTNVFKIKNVWSETLINTILQIMSRSNTFNTCRMLHSLKNCFTLPHFDYSSMGEHWNRLGKIFYKLIDDIVERNFSSFQQHSRNAEIRFVEPTFGEEKYFFNTPLDAIQVFIHATLPIHQCSELAVVIPILVFLIKNQKSKRSKIIISFIFNVINDIMIYVPKEIQDLDNVLALIFEFSDYVLSKYYEENFAFIAIESMIELKRVYPEEYAQHLLSLNPSTSSHIELLLQEYATP